MKKTLLITSLLVLLSAGFIGFLHISVLAKKDQVTYTDTIHYGDASMTEGLTVECNTQYDQKLFWNTTYKAGTSPSTETAYRFYTMDQQEYYESPKGISLESYTDNYYDTSLSEDDPLYDIPLIYHNLYNKTDVGESKSEIVYLKDYFEFYPIDIYIGFPDDSYHLSQHERNYMSEDEAKQLKSFSDYFKIPVLEEHAVRVEMDKRDESGYSSGSSDAGSDIFYLDSFSAIDEEYVYFTFNPHTLNGNLVDLSHIKDGYGIYRFPYSKKPDVLSDMYDVNFEELSMVYPLDPAEQIHYMSISEDKTKILLFGEDNKNTGSKIIVIDTKTLQTLQTIHIDSIEREDKSTEILCTQDVHHYQDFMVLQCSSRYLVVLTTTEDRLYNPEYVIDISAAPNHIYDNVISNFYWKCGFAWNGQELAIVQPLDIERSYTYYQSPGFQLSIFDKNGLKYYSTHDSSLDIGYSDEFWRPVRLQEAKEPALSVRWD